MKIKEITKIFLSFILLTVGILALFSRAGHPLGFLSGLGGTLGEAGIVLTFAGSGVLLIDTLLTGIFLKNSSGNLPKTAQDSSKSFTEKTPISPTRNKEVLKTDSEMFLESRNRKVISYQNTSLIVFQEIVSSIKFSAALVDALPKECLYYAVHHTARLETVNLAKEVLEQCKTVAKKDNKKIVILALTPGDSSSNDAPAEAVDGTPVLNFYYRNDNPDQPSVFIEPPTASQAHQKNAADNKKSLLRFINRLKN